jgi:hypothetical protein
MGQYRAIAVVAGTSSFAGAAGRLAGTVSWKANEKTFEDFVRKQLDAQSEHEVFKSQFAAHCYGTCLARNQ